MKLQRLSIIFGYLLGSASALANPIEGEVVHGQAIFSHPTVNTLNITNTPGTIINWQQFSIQNNETTRFIQQGATSSVLNRVVSQSPSDILGNLVSNGRVFVINPNGIVFGEDAVIDTAGLVASTLNITNEDFLAGNYHFEGDGGAIQNKGYIKAGPDGDIFLIAPNIENSGIIETDGGQLVLAAGQSLTIASLDSDHIVFDVQAPEHEVVNLGELITRGGAASVFAGTIRNNGAINADAISVDDQGRIVLSASSDINLQSDSVITASEGRIDIMARDERVDNQAVLSQLGEISADGERGGKINIQVDSLINDGEISARGILEGGSVEINASHRSIATSNSQIDVSTESGTGGTINQFASTSNFSSGNYQSNGDQGGEINLTGNEVKLAAANLDVSGENGGGTIRVGGGYQGQETNIHNSQNTQVNSTTVLNADANQSGDGGTVITWSDGDTRFTGSISATGGPEGGDGGFAEVSGKENLGYDGEVDLGAPAGDGGTLLLDPKFIEIIAGPASGGTGPGVINLLDPNPANGDQFGSAVAGFDAVLELSNGNIAVANPSDDFAASSAGAAYLFNGSTGALISTLTGSLNNDDVSSLGFVELTNGNFVIRSPDWSSSAGAVTWVDGNTGLTGTVSAANSITGSLFSDFVGEEALGSIATLSNGDFVVLAGRVDVGGVSDAGAVALIDGSNGQFKVGGGFGAMDATNSIFGTTADDEVGSCNAGPCLVELSNGNFVVKTSNWDNGPNTNAGSVTFINGTTGMAGAVSAANSIVGAVANEGIADLSNGILALNNGNYVVVSRFADIGTTNTGGVALIDGTDGTFFNGGGTGVLTNSNSLHGSVANDFVGNDIELLANDKYVVISSTADVGGSNTGAVTFVDGSTGLVGAVSAVNSLVGATASDQVGNNGVVELANGNYVVISTIADVGGVNTGAVTFGTNASGVTGTISAANSLHGSQTSDAVGNGGVIALGNGDYVVVSPNWDNGGTANVGAVTHGDGTLGTVGAVTTTNSLHGTTANDSIGGSVIKPVTELTNGNYVVVSRNWDNGGTTNVGAVTLVNGGTGTTGPVSAANSIIGSTAGDQVGFGGIVDGITPLTNGNFVIVSQTWINAGALDAGAVTLVDGTTGQFAAGGGFGVVTAANSLVGTQLVDAVGGDGVTALTNGNYVVSSGNWANGAASEAGAVTFGNGTTGVTGTISSLNSIVGTQTTDRVGRDGVTIGSSSVIAISDGNYAFSSSGWNNGGTSDAGAVTVGDGTTGTVGVIDVTNSIFGVTSNDQLGSGGIFEVGAGKVLVASPLEDTVDGADAGTVRILDPSTSGGFGNVLFATDQGLTTQITNGDIEQTLGAGTALILQANTDLTVNAAVNVSAGGSGGDLTLQAGRSVLINADITTDNGFLTIIANDFGAVGADRDAGTSEIIMADGTTLNAGTNTVDIDLNAGGTSGNIVIENIMGGGDVNTGVTILHDGTTAGSSILRASADSLITTPAAHIELENASNGSIGTVAEPLRVAADNLESHIHESTSLGIYIDAIGDVDIGGVPLALFGGFLRGIQIENGGEIVLTSTGTITLNGGGLAHPGGPIQTNTISGAGDITLRADDMALNNAVNANGSDVTIQPFSAFEDINIGGVGDLDLSVAELQNISAQTLIIGVSASSTTVDLSADITSADINANTLLLLGSSIDITGNINFAAEGENLTIDSFSTVDIDGSGGTPHSIVLGAGDFSVIGQPDFALVAGPNPNESISISADVINLDVFDYFQFSTSADDAFTELSATGDLTINAVDAIYVEAGGINGRAEIFGNNSNITSGGDIDLIAGTGIDANEADARIVNNSGTQLIDATGTITITGGNDFGLASIDNIAGTTQTINANDLLIEMPVAGAGDSSAARIDGDSQDINITNSLIIDNANPNASDLRTGILNFAGDQNVDAGFIEIYNDSQFGAAIQQLGAGQQIINTTGKNASGEGIRIEDNGSGTDGFAGIFCQNESGALCTGQTVTVTDADFVRILSNSAASPFGASIVTSSATTVPSSLHIHGSGLNALEIGTPTGASHAVVSNTGGPSLTVTVGDPGENGSVTIHGGSQGGPFGTGITTGGLGASSLTLTVQDSIIINGSTAGATARPASILSTSGDQNITVGSGGITINAGGNATGGVNRAAQIVAIGASNNQIINTTGPITINGGTDNAIARIQNLVGTSQSVTADSLLLQMPSTGAANFSAAQINGNDQSIIITNGITIDNANPNAADDNTGITSFGTMQDISAGFIEIFNDSLTGAVINQQGTGSQTITTTGQNGSGEGIILSNNSVGTGTGPTGITCRGPDDGGNCSGQTVTVNDADFVRIFGTKLPEDPDQGTGIYVEGWTVANAVNQTINIQGSGQNILELGSPTTIGEGQIGSEGATQTIMVGNPGEAGSLFIFGNDSVDGVGNGIFAGEIGDPSLSTTQTITVQDEIFIQARNNVGGLFTGIGTEGNQSVTAENGDITLIAGLGSVAGNNDTFITQFGTGFTQDISAVNGQITLTGGSDFGSAMINNINGSGQTIIANDLLIEMPVLGAAINSFAEIIGNQTITVANGLVLNNPNPNSTMPSSISGVGINQTITAGFIEISNASIGGTGITQAGAGPQIINTTTQNGSGEGLFIENTNFASTGLTGISCLGPGAGGSCNDQQVIVTDSDFVRLNGGGISTGDIGLALANQLVSITGSGQNALEIDLFGISADGPSQIVTVGNVGESGSITINGGNFDGALSGISIGSGSGVGTQTISVQDGININGGTAPGDSQALIIAAGGPQNITAGAGGITLVAGTNTGSGFGNISAIQQFGPGFDQTITLNDGGDLSLTGGNGLENNAAIILNQGGDISIQTGTGTGTSDLILVAGGGANSVNNYAAIEGNDPTGSNVMIDINGDIVMTGGTEASSDDAFVEIFANLGTLTVSVGGNVDIMGGAGTFSDAGMDSDLLIDLDIGGSLSLTGGTGDESGAGFGSMSFLVDVAGDINILGGSGPNSATGLGAEDVPVNLVLGNTAPIGGDINITGGSGAAGFTGLGNVCISSPCSATVTIDTSGSLNLQSGTGSPAFIGSVAQDTGVIDITAAAIDMADGIIKTNDNVLLDATSPTGSINQSANGVIDIGVNTLTAMTAGGDVSLLGTNNVIGNLVTNIGGCGSLSLTNTGLTTLGTNSVCGDTTITSANGIDISTPLALGTGVTLDAGTGIVDINGGGMITAGGDVNLTGADVYLNATGITDIDAAGFIVTINSTGEVTNFGATGGTPDVLAGSLDLNAVNGVELDVAVDNLNVTNTTAGSVIIFDTDAGLTADITNTGRPVQLESSSGSIALGGINGSTVDVFAGTSITDANGAGANITATSFIYNAPDGFGTFADPIETQVSSPIAVANSNGDIGIAQTGGLDLSGTNINASGEVNLSSTTTLDFTDANLSAANVQLQGATINVIANSGSAIINTNNLDIINTGQLNIHGSNTASGGSAKLQASNIVNIAADGISIQAGDADFAFAGIDPEAMNIDVTGDLNLVAGGGNMSEAFLIAEDINIVAGGEVNINGGAGDDAFAFMDASVGDINIEAASVSLEAGTGSNADAVIIANMGLGNVSITSSACTNCETLEADPFMDPEPNSGIFGIFSAPATDVPDNEQVIVLDDYTGDINGLNGFTGGQDEEEEDEELLECRI